MKKPLAIVSLLAAAMMAGCSEQPQAPAESQAPTQPASATASAASAFVEGQHYSVVDPQGQSEGPLVTEYFSLYCGACYNMESRFLPMIVPMLESQSIGFEQKHVNFAGNQTGEDVLRGYAILQQTTSGEQQKQLKETLFEILGGKHHDHSAHNHDDPQVENLADLRAIFVDAGVDGTAFDAAASSDVVNQAVVDWQKEQVQYQVQSVPSFVVNNRYLINMREVETLEQLVNLMGYLSAK